MKKILKNVLVCFYGLLISNSYGQEKNSCTVLDNENSGSYIGQCKNGLADGYGVYEYMDGMYVFEGKFKKGLKHGEGQLFSFINGEKKLIKEGVWKKSKYLGDKSKPRVSSYKIQKRVNIDRYSVRRVGEGNKVKFNFVQNGSRNNIEDLTLTGDSGILFSSSYNQSLNEGFDNVKFPFKCAVTYKTLSKLKFQTFIVRFEILINEPGVWEITLNN